MVKQITKLQGQLCGELNAINI